MSKLPQRKCTGCKEMKEKNTLLRVVKIKTGEIQIDKTNKADGRGAYVCNNMTCFEKAKKTKGFERSFRTKITPELYDHLKIEIENQKQSQ